MGRAVRATIWVAIVVLFVAVVFAVPIMGHKKAQQQLQDLRADVVASDFVVAAVEDGVENPRESTDPGQPGYEILVLVNGCTLQLKRAKGERLKVGSRRGQDIEAYALEEALGSSARIQIKDAPPAPVAADVQSYLMGNRSAFAYCLTTS